MSLLQFPRWIEASGFPTALNEAAGQTWCWALLRRLIEEDLARHPSAPGLLEIPPALLAAWLGIDVGKVEKGVRKLRAAGALRCFWPEHPEELGLFEILTPLPTPKTAEALRGEDPALFDGIPWPPRYSISAEEAAASAQATETRLKKVVDLYLSTFSMKMNSFILDDLQLLGTRYDLPLVEKAFQRAKVREGATLGWVLAEVRRELRVVQEAARLRAGGDEA